MDESRPQCGHAEYIKTVDLMANSYKQEFQVFSASSLCCTCFERTVISLDLQVLESHRVCQSFLQHRHHPTDMASLRREVLGGYKRLMRARLSAFKGDTTMLGASKEQLRIEFVKNQGVTDPAKIGERLQSRIAVLPWTGAPACCPSFGSIPAVHVTLLG